MNILNLREKLRKLEEELEKTLTVEMEEITRRRIESDMGDDYRENEGAKLVMEQHDVWYIRKVALKKEIGELRRKLVVSRSGYMKSKSRK